MIQRAQVEADTPSFRSCELPELQRLIAHTILDDLASVPVTLGAVTLMPHQRDAAARVHVALAAHHGALLADDVGLGKTFTALAVAVAYPHVSVVAPASLLPMWNKAMGEAAQRHVTVHSLHAFSTGQPVSSRAVNDGERSLLIIDEAHHLRNANSARYRSLAAAAAHRDVLLLSATPVHNRPSDLQHMLGLFLGSRTDALSDDMLAEIVVRRTVVEPENVAIENGETGSSRAASGTLHGRVPTVRRHPAMPVPYDAGTLSAIMSLPAPVPARDGAVAGALIRLGLLRAWCSSDAALSMALRKRILRADALRGALEAGRHPTNAELRTWLVGDHEVQLAFPELTVAHTVAPDSLLQVLALHASALNALLSHHLGAARGDGVRAHHVRELPGKHSAVPVLAFSQFTGTVNALHRALSDIAGVGSLSSTHGRIASGRISRADALGRFAPVAQGRPPPPPHQAIRLLLATDILSEGMNLQDAGVVVHLDLPWTSALLTQRVGRAARVGALHDEVHVYTFAIPHDVEDALRLLETLREKAEHARRLIGSDSTGATAATRLRSLLRAWSTQAGGRGGAQHVVPAGVLTDCGIPLIAAGSTAKRGWLALADVDGAPMLLASERLADRAPRTGALPIVVSDHASAVAAVVECIHHALPIDVVALARGCDAQRTVHAILRGVRAWHDARAVRREAGVARRSASLVQQRVASHVRAVLASSSAVARARLRHSADAAAGVVRAARGAGAEAELEAWYAARHREPAAEWLGRWRSFPLLAAGPAESDPPGEPIPDERGVVVRAVVLLGYGHDAADHA